MRTAWRPRCATIESTSANFTLKIGLLNTQQDTQAGKHLPPFITHDVIKFIKKRIALMCLESAPNEFYGYTATSQQELVPTASS